MEDINNSNVIYSVEKDGNIRSVHRVIDKLTGEVIFEREEDNLKNAIDSGLSSFSSNIVIRKQETPHGAACYCIEDDDSGLQLVAWKKESKMRARGGKKSYVKFYPDNLLSLSDELICTIVKLAPYIKTSGLMTDKKRRRRLSKKAIIASWGVGINKGDKLWKELRTSGIITENEHGFSLSRWYLSRG